MTRKQHKEIAKMWAASFTYQAGMDSFDSEFLIEDAGAIVVEMQNISLKMLGNRPLLNSLKEIIEWVLKNK